MTSRTAIRSSPRYISFHICEFRRRHLVKGNPVRKGTRKAPRRRRLYFYPKRRQQPANGLDRIGPFPSPTPSFLRLRFANSSLICRKPIVRHTVVLAVNAAPKRRMCIACCRGVIYENAKRIFPHCGHTVKAR